MDDTLFAHIQRKLPTFNLDVTRGLACKHMSGAEAYIENIMRCAESGFPPGLRYVDLVNAYRRRNLLMLRRLNVVLK